jgi:hypothetical protein
METKRVRLALKADDSGEFSAVIARLSVIDKDGDVTLPGAFPSGKEVLVSAYGHSSWGGQPPVGRAVIRERGGVAIAEGTFWVNTTGGMETYQIVKNAGSLQEWSYGFEIKEFSYGEHQGQRVRFLKSVNPFEISPVLVGAGVDTRTLAVRAHNSGRRPAKLTAQQLYAEHLWLRFQHIQQLRRLAERVS